MELLCVEKIGKIRWAHFRNSRSIKQLLYFNNDSVFPADLDEDP